MLKPVNQVETFSSDTELEELIKGFNPDIMIVGSDWKNKPVIGSQFAKRLIFFDRINEYSSTKIIQSIIDRG
jgi:bifunctional ADP-heptose synthase (sugar kinase/adenylyltransferase)